MKCKPILSPGVVETHQAAQGLSREKQASSGGFCSWVLRSQFPWARRLPFLGLEPLILRNQLEADRLRDLVVAAHAPPCEENTLGWRESAEYWISCPAKAPSAKEHQLPRQISWATQSELAHLSSPTISHLLRAKGELNPAWASPAPMWENWLGKGPESFHFRFCGVFWKDPLKHRPSLLSFPKLIGEILLPQFLQQTMDKESPAHTVGGYLTDF